MYSILIIEDDPSIRGNMELILKMEGFAVRTAGDGQAGIAAIREKRPDLVLCDILMPELNGLTVLELLRRGSDYADIPFIFVTALGERGDGREDVCGGAADYLTNPFPAEELIAAVPSRLHRFAAVGNQGDRPVFRKEHALLRHHISTRERQGLLLV